MHQGDGRSRAGSATRAREGAGAVSLPFHQPDLPDDHVVKIQGGLQSLPGDEKNRTQDAEGTIEPVDQIDRDVYTVAKGVVAGGLAGAITRSGPAAGIGMGIGGGLALGKVLFTRGDEIRLPREPKWRWYCSRRS